MEANTAVNDNVVHLPLEMSPARVEEKEKQKRGIEARWGARLSVPFSPVSRYFLCNYHRLKPHPGAKGLSSTEAMLVIQLLDFKWDSRAPYPALTTLGERMSLSVRQVRATVKRLEDLKYLKREPAPYGGPNRYHLDGLMEALHKMMDADIAAKDAAEAKKEEVQ